MKATHRKAASTKLRLSARNRETRGESPNPESTSQHQGSDQSRCQRWLLLHRTAEQAQPDPGQKNPFASQECVIEPLFGGCVTRATVLSWREDSMNGVQGVLQKSVPVWVHHWQCWQV